MDYFLWIIWTYWTTFGSLVTSPRTSFTLWTLLSFILWTFLGKSSLGHLIRHCVTFPSAYSFISSQNIPFRRRHLHLTFPTCRTKRPPNRVFLFLFLAPHSPASPLQVPSLLLLQFPTHSSSLCLSTYGITRLLGLLNSTLLSILCAMGEEF